MRIRRDIASVPARSAKETWQAIISLVVAADSVDADQLTAAASIMQSLISDEQPAEVPIVFKGSGPRVLIYCAYNEDAMQLGLDVDPLSTTPTVGDWQVTAPCEPEDVAWMNQALADRAPRIRVHEPGEATTDVSAADAAESDKIQIDWGAVQNS
ncbi:MAG: hypothetical protein ACQGVC_01680 [Myxococcota bacterium]